MKLLLELLFWNSLGPVWPFFLSTVPTLKLDPAMQVHGAVKWYYETFSV